MLKLSSKNEASFINITIIIFHIYICTKQYMFRTRKLSDSRADAKISRWSKEGNLFWADPANWNGTSIAAPHLERVPCRQDDVVLPSVNRTLSILLPVREIEVKSIRLSNEQQPFTEWEWEDFQDRREFSRGRFTVK